MQANKYGYKRVEFTREHGTGAYFIESKYLAGRHYLPDYKMPDYFTPREIARGFTFVSDDMIDIFQSEIDFYAA